MRVFAKTKSMIGTGDRCFRVSQQGIDTYETGRFYAVPVCPDHLPLARHSGLLNRGEAIQSITEDVARSHQMAFQGQYRDIVFRLANLKHGLKPFAQQQLRTIENRTRTQDRLMAAVTALPIGVATHQKATMLLVAAIGNRQAHPAKEQFPVPLHIVFLFHIDQTTRSGTCLVEIESNSSP